MVLKLHCLSESPRRLIKTEWCLSRTHAPIPRVSNAVEPWEFAFLTVPKWRKWNWSWDWRLFEKLCPAEKTDPQTLASVWPQLAHLFSSYLPPSNSHWSYMLATCFHQVRNTSALSYFVPSWLAKSISYPAHMLLLYTASLTFSEYFNDDSTYCIHIYLFYITALFLLFFKPFSFTVGLTIQETCLIFVFLMIHIVSAKNGCLVYVEFVFKVNSVWLSIKGLNHSWDVR